MAQLSKKHQVFIKEYLIDQNGTRAAIAAGYSEKSAYSTASEILSNPKVKKALQLELDKKFLRADVTAERVINGLADHAFSKVIGAKDRIKALEVLAKYFKLLTDNVNLSGKVDGPQIILTLPDNNRAVKDEPTNH